MTCITPVVEYWLQQEIAQCVHLAPALGDVGTSWEQFGWPRFPVNLHHDL